METEAGYNAVDGKFTLYAVMKNNAGDKMSRVVRYRHNIININSIDAFLNIKGGYNNNIRDVYFVREIGEPADLINKVLDIDKKMSIEMSHGRLVYIRIGALPRLGSSDDIDFYSNAYEQWKASDGLKLKGGSENTELLHTLNAATEETVAQFKKLKRSATDSIIKNFVVKLWFWADFVLKDVIINWSERSCIKVVADNVVIESEYLFYYFLTLLGCDVLLIQNRQDINTNGDIKSLSSELQSGSFGSTKLPEFVPYKESASKPESAGQDMKAPETGQTAHGGNIKVSIPPRQGRKSASPDTQNTRQSAVRRPAVSDIPASGQINSPPAREKTFEELALLSSYIVLITVCDQWRQPMGTGSGIMIGSEGYILTNNHVVAGGSSFSVRIEDDEQIYPTNEVIKYNSVLDLAVIRINKQLKPLPIYRGNKKLVRGQKVVAIGSPLGLFNSVSDGIISGFRNIHDVDMIQFTAPISPGSSGGAVLNMQGELIGISTAGIDNGQNINLAVSYESIRMFAKGFYKN